METPSIVESVADIFKPQEHIKILEIKKKQKPEEIKKIQQEKIEKISFEIFKEMLSAITQKKAGCFDGHVKDFGCERQALTIYNILTDITVIEEIHRIEEEIKKEKTAVDIYVSEKVAFLARCFFLKKFSMIQKNKNDEWVTVIDLDRFYQQVTGQQKAGYSAKKNMTEYFNQLQSHVSQTSFKFLKEEVSKISQIEKEEIKTIEEIFNGTKPNKEKKYIISNYYSIKTAFSRFLEIETPILLKEKATPSEESFCILYPNSVININNTTPLIVIEGKPRKDLSPEILIQKIKEIGIRQIALMAGACIEREHIKDLEVLKWKKIAFENECVPQGISGNPKESFSEIVDRCSKELDVDRPRNNNIFDFYHIYCSTIAEEIEKGAKVI